MAGHLHFQTPSALAYFAALVADDAGFPVLEAAIALAQDEDPRLDVQGVLARVDVLALRLKRRMPADAPALQRLRLLNRYFFQELGFAGNVNDYHDPRNSLLPVVLESRRGIPITLALLYCEIAGQIGLTTQPLPFPGHVLVKVAILHGDVVLDPFNGQSLSRQTLQERLPPLQRHSPMTRAQGAHDEDRDHGSEPLSLEPFLQPAPGRALIARMLRNLRHIYSRHQDWMRLERVQARTVLLLPEAWEEHRDHAIVLAELGAHWGAAQALALYLQHRPDAADAPALRRRLAAWRSAP
ncbi:MAG: tetratricopeptide repeat protein [Rubrivivax sp.]|nr:tetratricopeptide repeat protein [Rubrivivax sp.]